MEPFCIVVSIETLTSLSTHMNSVMLVGTVCEAFPSSHSFGSAKSKGWEYSQRDYAAPLWC